MADPLQLLRQANIDKRPVVTRDGLVIFDSVSFRGSDSTNFRKSVRTETDETDGVPGSGYYPISSIAFFLRCKSLKYTDYLRSASAEGFEPVSRVDRKVLLDFLSGTIPDCENIDKFAPLATPVQRSARGISSIADSHAPSTASSLISVGPTDIRHVAHLSGIAGPSAGTLTNQSSGSHAHASASTAPVKPTSGAAVSRGGRNSERVPDGAAAAGGISQTISTSRIAELKAKLQKRKLETTKTTSSSATGDDTAVASLPSGKRDDLLSASDRDQRDLSRLVSRLGRQYVDRKSVLHIQGSSTNWSDIMSPFVLQLRTNLEAGGPVNMPQTGAPAPMPFNGAAIPSAALTDIKSALVVRDQMNTGDNNASMVAALKKARTELDAAGYSRYDQERFMGANTQDIGFKFDPMATYSTMNVVKALKDGPAISSQTNYYAGTATSQALDRQQNSLRVTSRSPGGTGGVMKTPIIIIPNISNSLISLQNVRSVIEELRYVSPEDAKRSGAVETDTIVIHRRDPANGELTSYKVTNNPARLLPEDWHRVVAAFVQGQTWQFKGWPWPSPVEIFNNVRGFHLKWDDMPLDPNIAKWNVQVVQFSRSKRHLDKAAIIKFWDIVERNKQRPG